MTASTGGRLTRRQFLLGAAALAGGLAAIQRGVRAAPRADLEVVTLTGSGLLFSVGATGAALVQVEAWPGSSGRPRVRSEWVPTGAGRVAKVSVGRRPWFEEGVAWRTRVRAAGASSVTEGEPRRLPPIPRPDRPSRFTFAFGSCILQDRPAPTLEVAARQDPVFLAVLGDLGYQDDPVLHPGVQNYRGYLTLFRRMLSQGDLGRLLRRAAFVGVPDDHDYGQDGAWRKTIKPYAARAYAAIVPGAAWPDPNYRRWRVGQVEFFLTDNRRFKDPPGGPFENGRYMSVLGRDQRDWLLSGLASSRAPVKCVFIPMTMAWYWSPQEAAEVRAFVREHVEGRVLFLSGDKHAGAFVRYPEGIWEVLAAPIENPRKHQTPERPGVVWTESGAGRARSNVVGIVDVDTAEAGVVTLRIMGEDGSELHREAVPVEPSGTERGGKTRSPRGTGRGRSPRGGLR